MDECCCDDDAGAEVLGYEEGPVRDANAPMTSRVDGEGSTW